jgi:histidinol-phosphatase (PHP family)
LAGNATNARVSVHGGHSGEFCTHAADSLEEIVKTYIALGFTWVGITEHMPPPDDRFVYDDEKAAGLDAERLLERFIRYVETCKQLKETYREQVELFFAFETESYSGSIEFVRRLQSRFSPDYLVGSLHHVDDHAFDYTREGYFEAAESLGGLDALYCRYFDEQYAMIEQLRPQVVGHFDLIRIFDPDHPARLRKPEIHQRIHRNLDLIEHHGLILDCNLKGFGRPATAGAQPNPVRDILVAAVERGIAIVPGDDSHGVRSVGRNYEEGVALLEGLGADLDWKKPVTTQSKGHV